MQKIENESKDKSFLNSWLSSKKVLKQETASLSIDSLTLHNDKDKTSGIMTFFESAFLTTLIQGGYLIKINRLSGLDDLSQRFFSTSLTSAIKKQKTEATFKKNQRLTLTDVKIITPHIINQTETFIISFLIENQPFSLTYELNEDTMIWELVIDDLKNPEVIIQNIFGKYPLQTIIINPSYKMDEKQEYINAFLIRGIDCNAPNEDKITPLFQATIQHFTEKSNYYLIIESLLKAGADIYYKPKNSRIPSPLEYVISKKNAKIIALFKKYEETESTSDKENEPKVKLNINEKINTFDFYL